ncbi:hypothetical protein [Actinomadura sp. NBRC 104425]|uniref:hypothetical protein n=1 Tax=Actinomadura sp. NBRC 104425 TaxID=3032204 RepID=UPI002555D6EF|nr:hypothetical protein [Actinomadura sp. NBRC 104425]
MYNDGLRTLQDAHEQGLPYIRDADLQRRVLTEASPSSRLIQMHGHGGDRGRRRT